MSICQPCSWRLAWGFPYTVLKIYADCTRLIPGGPHPLILTSEASYLWLLIALVRTNASVCYDEGRILHVKQVYDIAYVCVCMSAYVCACIVPLGY